MRTSYPDPGSLFTRVRGKIILRSSANRPSKKFGCGKLWTSVDPPGALRGSKGLLFAFIVAHLGVVP
jgi:hypothetical protein